MNIDLNYFKYEKLFQDDLYRNIYEQSKKHYAQFLPKSIKLGDMFLRGNYTITEKEFIPNSELKLYILIGCCPINFALDNSDNNLYLFFHIKPFNNFRDQYCDTVKLKQKISGQYMVGELYDNYVPYNSFCDENKLKLDNSIKKFNMIENLTPNWGSANVLACYLDYNHFVRPVEERER